MPPYYIYKIHSPLGSKVYIGSTLFGLSVRFKSHKWSYTSDKKLGHKGCSSYILFDEYGVENCFIKLIEKKNCNRKEAEYIEGFYIKLLKCVNYRNYLCVNKNIPGKGVLIERQQEMNIKTIKLNQSINSFIVDNNKEPFSQLL